MEFIKLEVITVDGRIHLFERDRVGHIKSIKLDESEGVIKIGFSEKSKWDYQTIYLKNVISLRCKPTKKSS